MVYALLRRAVPAAACLRVETARLPFAQPLGRGQAFWPLDVSPKYIGELAIEKHRASARPRLWSADQYC
jgi:hypothetical protein